jgi:signal transduction protein with GAF and PtsI domain
MDFTPFSRASSLPWMENLPEQGLKALIQLISNVTEAFTAALFLYTPERERLFIKCHHSLSMHINPQVQIQVGNSLIGWVAKNNRPVNIAQFDRDTRNLKLYQRDEGIKAFLAVPVEGEGVLMVDSKRNYVFTEKDQKILQDFARLVHQFLASEKVYQKAWLQAQVLAFIHRINTLSLEADDLNDYYQRVLQCCREFSNTDAAFLVLVPRKGDRYKVVASEGKLRAPLKKTALPIDMGLTGWVIREEKPLVRPFMKPRNHRSYVFFPDDPCMHFQSYLGLPISFYNRLCGVINLIGYQENHWEEEMIQALLLAGQTITTSILYLMNT